MTFPAHKAAAISFTFDDGSQCHADIAVPLLDACGFKATFFVIAGLTREKKVDPLLSNRPSPWWGEVSWEEWRSVARTGHEIGNHSLTHPILPRVRDPQQLRAEVADSARMIADRLGQPPQTFAYPYNKTNVAVRAEVLRHHRAARETRTRYGGFGFTVRKANRLVDRAIRRNEWIVAMIHGIGSGYDSIDPELLREHLRYIKQRESEIWVDTFGNISRHWNAV